MLIESQILESQLSIFCAFPTTFTSGDAHVFRNSGDSQGLEAWRRLHTEYAPTSSMRRVTIHGYVQNPTTCDRIEDLGFALEEWLAKKRQYEEFSNRDGSFCRVQYESLMAAMCKIMPKRVEETVMFKSDEDTFESLFYEFVPSASVKRTA